MTTMDDTGTALRAAVVSLRLYAGKCLGRGLSVDETVAELGELRDSLAAMRIWAAGANFDVLVLEVVQQALDLLRPQSGYLRRL